MPISELYKVQLSWSLYIQSARYAKAASTFVDAIALVRRHLWLASAGFSMSPPLPDDEKVTAAL